ncbi:uncharacterized protein DFL_007789 [Arthrobotrys flagrans]|uniref:Uncharacterized protein n=1 Tax=Arthrobotrys flagrans TaxID=97331 RepID=A0A436ZX36_ARTFL|nr:hypothetical protein DFL_007789 [Arthrobotrys flagrans]
MEVPQTREQTLEVLRDFINPNTTSLEEITNEYCKILEQFENDIFIDRDEDIDVMDIGTGNKEEEEPTTSEINKIFRSTQDEIAQALKNDETFDPEVEGLLEQVRTRKRNEYHEANPGTVPKTEEERAEKVKVPPTSTALRAGRPPFWIPAPLDPDFGPAFNILPLDVAATVLYHFIRKRWEFNRVRANGQTWYQLIRILRAADVHAAWKRINRTLRMTLAITSPMARLELWAGSNKNYLDARGVASPNQGLLHARSILYLTQLCRILMNPVQVSVACPFCGVNNPDPFNHRHSELMIIVKLFLQRWAYNIDLVLGANLSIDC